MGPVIVLLFWLIVGVLAVGGYLLLRLLGRRSPVAAQISKIVPAFAVAIVATLALVVVGLLITAILFR